MLKNNRCAALLVGLVCLSAGVRANASSCEEGLVISGSLFTGKMYKIAMDLPGASSGAAFRGAYRFVVKEGWKVQQSDKDAGVIAAVNNEYFNKGKTLPLNVVVEPTSGGARISLTYSTPAGLSSPDEAVRDHLCKLVAAASESAAASTADAPKVGEPRGANVTRNTPSTEAGRGQPIDDLRQPAAADGDFALKATEEVTATIKVVNVLAGRPMLMNRSVKLTYQALKPCRELMISGHSYSKDGAQLAPFIVGSRFAVQPGQTFRDDFLVAYEKGHYMALDRAICLR